VDTGNGTLHEVDVTVAKADLDNNTTGRNGLLALFNTALNSALTTAGIANKVTAELDGKKLKLKVKQDGTQVDEDDGTGNIKQILVPARIAIFPDFGQTSTVVTGDDADGKKSLKHVEKIVASQTDNTFVFGNNWGLSYYFEKLFGNHAEWAKHEPDYFTARANKDSGLTIDTSKVTNNQKKLVLDFRNVGKELSFTFADNGKGGTKLPVTRASHLPPGTPGPYNLVPSFVKWLKEDMGQDWITDEIEAGMNWLGRFLNPCMAANISFGKIVFTDVGENTVIYGGRDQNTFTVAGTAQFDGLLVAGTGLRPPGEFLLDPGNIQGLVGLDLPEIFVSNTLKYSPPGLIDLLKHPKQNVRGLFRYVNLGGIPKISEHAPGLNKDSLQNIDGITVGPGINVVVGSNFDSGVRWNSDTNMPTFDKTKMQLGADTITIKGTSILPIPGNNIVSKALQKMRDATFLNQAIGVHVLSGMTGGDTYKIEAKLWGAALILEIPDITIGGVTPECYDTLDFSGLYNNMDYFIWEVTTENIDGFTSLFQALGQTAGEGARPTHVVDVGTNIVLATDGGLGDLLSLPGIPPEVKDIMPDAFVNSLQDIHPDIKLGSSVLLANDIENIVASRGTNTFHFIDGARLQGAISSNIASSVHLDYSGYFDEDDPPENNEGVNVDYGAGGYYDLYDEFPDWMDDGLSKVGSQLVPLLWSFGSADGVIGNRLGQFPLLNQATGAITNHVLGVSGGTDVKGSPYDDDLTGSGGDNVFYGNGGQDTIDGDDGTDTINYAHAENTVVIDLQKEKAWENTGRSFYSTTTQGDESVNEVQQIWNNASHGTFTITFDGQTTGDLVYNAPAGDIDTALEALSNIDGVTVSGEGAEDDPWTITFLDPGNQDVSQLTTDDEGLWTPGSVFSDLISIESLAGGTGDDLLIGDAEDNTYYFSDEWGDDLVLTNGGKDVINFEGVSKDDDDKPKVYKVEYIKDDGDLWNDFVNATSELYMDAQVATAADDDVDIFLTLYEDDIGNVHVHRVVVMGSYDEAKGIKTEDDNELTALESGLNTNATPLTDEQLTAIVAEAIERWGESSLDEWPFVIEDLPGRVLGKVAPDTVYIDTNGAGVGWFVDNSPGDDNEFTPDGSGVAIAGTDSPAYGQYDLLTVAMHELGHVLGLDHVNDVTALMSRDLSTSVRKPGL